MSRRFGEWIREYWRPLMSVVYMIVILFDFIVAPVLWSLLQAYFDGIVTTQWVPLTLASGAIFHIAMGGVLGISSFTRGQEKLEELKLQMKDIDKNGNK